MNPVDILIIGNGHYVSGMTSISDVTKTDKDRGVLVPSAIMLRAEGLVDHIAVAARNLSKLNNLKIETFKWAKSLNLNGVISVFGSTDTDDSGVTQALDANPNTKVALIAVPDHLHITAMKACIERGIHFLIVKPALTRLEDFYEVLFECERKNIFCMVDFHKVFDESNLLISEELQSGKFGRIHHVYSLMTQKSSMLDIFARWLTADNSLNINHYLGSHYAHLIGFVTDSKPIDVRARQHFGKAQRKFDRPIADLIDMQVTWKQLDEHTFTSHHVSGWGDPKESESMTYQELHVRCEHGFIDSDQRHRGTRTLLDGTGYASQNPYFFGLSRNLFGGLSLNAKYGYTSVKTFVQAAMQVISGECLATSFDKQLPTLRQSAQITAILEAADKSIAMGSSVIPIDLIDGRYILSH